MDDDMKELQRLADCGGMELEFLELKRDAERYRWLRRRQVECAPHISIAEKAAERFDSAIDRAMSAAPSVGAA